MFKSHGAFDLTLNGRILEADIKGAWNVETAHDYSASVGKFINVLSGEPWALISIVDDFELFTPECYPVIVKLAEKAYRSGLVNEAFVNYTDSIKMQVFKAKIDAFPDFQRGFFRTKVDALNWLKQQGFE